MGGGTPNPGGGGLGDSKPKRKWGIPKIHGEKGVPKPEEEWEGGCTKPKKKRGTPQQKNKGTLKHWGKMGVPNPKVDWGGGGTPKPKGKMEGAEILKH